MADRIIILDLNGEEFAYSISGIALDRLDQIDSTVTHSLQRYVLDGYHGGGHFFSALLENDLMRAVTGADLGNQRALPYLCRWLYSYVPTACYGSTEKVNAWIAAHMARGHKAKGGS